MNVKKNEQQQSDEHLQLCVSAKNSNEEYLELVQQ